MNRTRVKQTRQLGEEAKPRFPEKIEYIISPQEAQAEIHKALEKITDFRKRELQIFKTLIGPLVPDSVRNKIQKSHLDDYSVPYSSLVNGIGNFTSALILFGLDEFVGSVKDNSRLIILPYLELKLQKKIEQIKREKPFGWRIIRKFYQRNLDNLKPLVDNLIHLISLAWTFCPAIGEPEKETGFYNRFVFTSNGGFIDLGHFFNCSIIAYLCGIKDASRRAEDTEIQQAALRRKKWLVRMREKNYLLMVTNLLWGYATSANTIEDRASDKLGIMLGEYMRKCQSNGKLIDFFVDLYLKSVRDKIKIFRRRSIFGRAFDTTKIVLKGLICYFRRSATIDIEKYMRDFFDEYDAIDPKESAPQAELFKNIVDFYTQKYFGPEWENYGCKEWSAVIPQDLWEKVVRNREKFEEKAVPIKVQIKKTGELISPYHENQPPETK